ncbi:MAG: flagellar hook-associated protein FlgL [Dehalococcoidia bacterium]|nr:flagellar hook-associated protein FlgL [Dehalococcoidia bacterium]
MTQRVSDAQRLANHQAYMAAAQGRMDNLQQQLATGRKIERASDDPAGASLALQHRRNIAFESQMRRNIDGGLAFMNATEAALDGATQSLQRARELAVQASSDSMGAPQRDAIAEEMDQIINHLVQVGNTRFGEAYIFGGHQSQQPAFSIVPGPDGAAAVNFDGDNGERLRRISHSDEAAVNVSGEEAFGQTFDDLIALRNTLRNGSPGEDIAPSIENIEGAIERVLAARSDIGARTNRFEAAQRQSEVTNIDLQELRSNVEDVDIARAIVEMQGAQTSLQAAIGAIGRTNNMTLLNFLR